MRVGRGITCREMANDGIMDLDTIEQRILRELQTDAILSNVALVHARHAIVCARPIAAPASGVATGHTPIPSQPSANTTRCCAPGLNEAEGVWRRRHAICDGMPLA
jgi:hypothetical protein